jgi:hypothetical protein
MERCQFLGDLYPTKLTQSRKKVLLMLCPELESICALIVGQALEILPSNLKNSPPGKGFQVNSVSSWGISVKKS